MYQQVFKQHTSLLKALAHPKRLEIIQLLRGHELSVTDIQQMLALPQANLSQHLQVLRAYEVVTTRRVGKQIYYHLGHDNFIKASDLLRQVLINRQSNKQEVNELIIKMVDLVPLVVDPVCGMRLSPKTAGRAYNWQKKYYYFCAAGCYQSFKSNPQKYVSQ